MKAFAVTMLLAAALLSAGCSGVDLGGSAEMSARQTCEGTRNPGVWVEAAGACIRGGGN